MKVRSGARTGVVARRVGAVVVVLSAALAGCSFSDHEPKETVDIWRSGDQFVRLEPPRAILAGQPPRNAHPVSISADQLRNALRLILVKEPPKSPSRPLFTPAALEALGRRLEAGLARARPDQDVTFAIDQHTQGVFGLKGTQVISGRVFFTGQWLHLIFGSVLGHDVADEGPAIDSYLPGRRDVRVGDPVILAAAGSGIYRAPGVDRADWLVFGPQALAIRPPAPPGRPQTPGPQTPLPQSTWPQAYPPQPYWPQIPGPQAYPPQPYWPQTPGPQSTWPQGYPPQPY